MTSLLRNHPMIYYLLVTLNRSFEVSSITVEISFFTSSVLLK